MSFKVEPCTGYELSFVFYIGSSDNTATEIHGRFLESDPSLDDIISNKMKEKQVAGSTATKEPSVSLVFKVQYFLREFELRDSS